MHIKMLKKIFFFFEPLLKMEGGAVIRKSKVNTHCNNCKSVKIKPYAIR